MAPSQSRQTASRVVAAAAVTAALASCSSGFVAPSGLPQQQQRQLSTVTAAPGAAGLLPFSAAAGLLAVAGSMASGFSTRAASKRSPATARRAEENSIAATAAANGSFTTLVAALTKAGVVEPLTGSNGVSYTVFAPTDEAFKALLSNLGVTAEQLLARPDLKSILLYHVVRGVGASKSLSDGMSLATVQGDNLAVKVAGGGVQVGGANVVTADIKCSNGIIHVIDKVLLPASNVKFEPSKQFGSTAPFGFFDPLGLSSILNEAEYKIYQQSEIKHGRVAMMASIGFLGQHFAKFPGFEAVPPGLKALVTDPGYYGFGALVVASGILEFTVFSQNPRKEPGNFGDPAGFNQYTPEMRQREINNGRMAMISVAGIIVAELVTGKDGIQQFGL